MRRSEPPSLATWILEHLTPADRDEAVAGDLLEVYRLGRSNAWYWRQVLAASTAAWARKAGDRKPLVVFAVLWAMLAPSWIALEARLESGLHTSQLAWRMDGLSSIYMGLLLNTSFLWLGILFYLAAHGNFTRTFSRRQISRAFMVTPIVFFLAYFLTFVLMNLFYFHGPVVDHLTMGPIKELIDLRIWADALRIPYFVTLVCALCGLSPHSRRSSREVMTDSQLASAEPAVESDAFAIAFRDPDEWSANRFIGMMISVGLLNAFIASLIFCRLPASHAPTISNLFLRAVIYVAITVVAGVAGTRFYWSKPTGLLASAVPVSASHFALIGASASVWLPAAMLFSPQDSPASPLIVAAATAILASGLRKAIPAQVIPDLSDHELFAEVLRRPSRSADGYVIAIGIYLALLAIATHQSLNAGAPLAVCAWLIAWRLTPTPGDLSCVRDQISGAVRRLVWMAAAAIFVTFVALMFGVEHRNRLTAETASTDAGGAAASSDRAAKQSRHTGLGAPGYESIILWPQPEKKQIILPLPSHLDLLPPGAKRPLILSFTGSYWYFQPPNSGPGLRAHLAHGTPTKLNIQSSNALPLTMDANQRLAGSISLARCREVQITLANRDSHAGSLAVAVLLMDSSVRGQPAVYLGQQPIDTRGLEGSAADGSPRDDVLRFAVPESAKIRAFDTITVMFLAGPLHRLTAPKIAIEQFEIVPR